VQGSAHSLRVLCLHEFPNISKNMRGMESSGGPGEDGTRGLDLLRVQICQAGFCKY